MSPPRPFFHPESACKMLDAHEFLSALDTAPLGFCLVDSYSYHIRYANPDFGSILMLRGKLEGQRLDDLMPPEFIDYLFNHALISFEREMTVTRTDGAARWIKVMGERLKYKGKESYALWIVDITNDKMIAEKLTVALGEADAAAEMKANLLATMSHEIRTPLQAVYGFLELIGEVAKGQKNITDMVETAKTAGSGLLEILDDVLDLAKLDADKMELDAFEVPLRTLARGTIEALAVRKHSNIALLDEIAESVPFVIKGDPKRLRQIIMNLMGNAIKFTQKGSVTLRIHTDAQFVEKPDDDTVVIRFEIVDTGIGMPKEVCDKLFQPFTQADSSTTRKFGGTGLGLSICKKLVDLMGGRLGVFSEAGKGSTFWFEIPTRSVGTNTTTVELPNLEGLAVLVVEDHPMAVREIQNSLRSMGAEVEACGTYKEGLELVKRRPFNVGVIDQGLPDGLGLDLMKEIMDARPSMGLLMYTVRDDYGLQHSLRAMGATYLTKPASRAGLGESVKDAAKKDAMIRIDGPARLLIAEDTETVRDILRRQLSMFHVEADFVENGRLAYEKLKEGKHGILISDLHMPEMDGYGLIQAIRADEKAKGDGKHFPVIVLTADVQMAQRQSYLSEGFDECLLKPVSLGQLRQLLIRWGLLNEDDAIRAIDGIKSEPADAGAKGDDTPAAQANTKPPAIDLKAMEEQMGAVNADTAEMIEMFAEMTQELVDEIRGAFDAGDAHQLEESAHSLKGSARSACCMVLGDIASQLQDDAKDIGNCAHLVEGIEEEFKRVVIAAQELVDRFK